MKLQGNDALDKAQKLFEFMDVTPKVDSFSNVESIHLAYDGKHYGIVKENTKYILKVSEDKNPTISEDFDYVNGVQNKQKYSKTSYTEAMKLFNYMNIEYSRVYGNKLMTEALEEKKYVISAKKKTDDRPIDDIGGVEMPPMDDDELPMDDEEISTGDELDMGDGGTSEDPDDYKDVDPDDLDAEDPKKSIQKLAGKLAYELREFDDEEEYSDTAKFAMSMATSALQTDKMSDEDKNAIGAKIDSKLNNEDSEEDSNMDDLGDDNLDLEETKSALDNIHTKVGSFAVDEPMMERVVLTKEQFLSAVNEGYIFEGIDSLEVWANKISNMFNTGKISSSMELLKIIENNVEDHDLEVDFYKLRDAFQEKVSGSKVTPEIILDIVDAAMPKPAYEEDMNEDIFFEIEGQEDNLDIYDVDPEDILFDVEDDPEDVFEIDLEEEVYSDEPKRIKNKKYVQDYFGMDVGRVVGDDDAQDYIVEDDIEETEDFDFGKIHIAKQEPRNPFKYKA